MSNSNTYSNDDSEPLTLDNDAQTVYGYIQQMLEHTPLTTLSELAIPSIVPLSLPSSSPSAPATGDASSPPAPKALCPESLRTALEGMQNETENLEQRESQLIYLSPLTIPFTQLTVPALGTVSITSPQQAIEQLQASVSLGGNSQQQRRVCQTQFKKNDMIYMCRTCQTDPTCALCHDCFSDSNHDGHDVAFFHATEDGGCCDCGDPDAWNPNGFCTKHGDNATQQQQSEQHHHQQQTSQRAICQYPFQKNDMIYMCRTCQTDPTCAMCHDCFSQSNHEGHDVAFFHAQETGGCCDCGDPEAWAPSGFCPNHGGGVGGSGDGGNNDASQPTDVSSLLPAGMVSRVQGVVPGVLDWMVQQVATACSKGYERASPSSTPSYGRESLTHLKQLGQDGRQGQGLFLVLYYDDIHAIQQWMDMIRDLFRGGSGSTGSRHYYNDTLIGQLLQALQKYGMLVVWGPCELQDECGAQQVESWLSNSQDNTTTASSGGTTIASVIFNKAMALVEHRFSCRIVTLQELKLEQRALSVLQWISVVAGTCDPLCQTVAENVLTRRHLAKLLQSDHILSTRIKKVWYSFLLKLLAIRSFKTNLGRAYGMVYRTITKHYAEGRSGGALETSAYTLSVQFLNQDKYLLDLIAHQDWLGTLSTTLRETLQQATTANSTATMNPNHIVLSHRRYQPCITDIMYALNVQGIKRIMASPSGTFLPPFLDALSLGQFMDSQIWRHWDLGHVEQEELGWYGAFNWIITTGGIVERLMWWKDDEECPESLSSSIGNLPSCIDVTFNTLISSIDKWQTFEMQKPKPSYFYDSADNIARNGHQLSPLSLPYSTVATNHGCSTAIAPKWLVTQSTPFSLHLPLHRFLASCLRELSLRPNGTRKGVDELLRRLRSAGANGELSSSSLLFHGLTEVPSFVASRAAQVRAGLWRRNGPGLQEQVLKYTDPSYCRFMRDPDLLLLQFAALLPWQEDTKQRSSCSGGLSFLIHLLLHRFGLFDFCGLAKSPQMKFGQYEQELKQGWFPREYGEDTSGNNNGLVLPWIYTPARDAADCRALLEEFLNLMILFATEIPPVPPKDQHDHTEQAKARLRRHVVHRLAAGPKTYGELVEINTCMSFQDNMLLNDAGKVINPDDATAAMLGLVLGEVADRKASRSRLEPDKFELKQNGWDSYDPSFFHVSVESHQTAAENRPNPSDDKKNNNGMFGGKGRPLAPRTEPGHPTFMRLRRDLTSDSTILGIIYRVLHMHCSQQSSIDRVTDLECGKHAYDKEAKSEITLARAVHLLTVGAFAWESAGEDQGESWRENGGASAGSVFFDTESPPSVADWIAKSLLANPGTLLDCSWYSGEDPLLILLKRLAVDGGATGNFTVQDPAVQAGAAWICEFAVKHSVAAAELVGTKQVASNKTGEVVQNDDLQNESELQKRKRLAKERAMAKMNAQAAKFAQMMGAELDQDDGEEDNKKAESEFERKKRLAKEKALAKISNQASKFASMMGVELEDKASEPEAKVETEFEKKKRLAKEKALAKINNQASKFASMMGVELEGEKREETELEKKKRLAKEKAVAKMNAQAAKFASMMATELGNDDDGDTDPTTKMKSPGKSTKRLLEEHPQCIICSDSDAECFVAFSQASTVLQGGGNPPDEESRATSFRRFVGTHVALCGHAVHSNCCKSYLVKAQEKEEEKSDIFRCPLCQRPSNCLVPFVDIGSDWIDLPTLAGSTSSAEMSSKPLHDFLSTTYWWESQRNPDVKWNGQSSFVLQGETMEADETNVAEPTDQSMYIRFMENAFGVGFDADKERLGQNELEKDFGEFRHHLTETIVSNAERQASGLVAADWPECVLDGDGNQADHGSLAREKVLSHQMTAVQSFSYSCCCEAAAARDMIGENYDDEDLLRIVNSKFGIGGVLCDGKLLVMPRPDPKEDGGTQPFNGRMGRLRYLGLAVASTSGAFAFDFCQLALQLPVSSIARTDTDVERSPIAYPILLGHVLTHVVAAICASMGKARADTDSYDAVWKSFLPSYAASNLAPGMSEGLHRAPTDEVVDDCLNFLKLGVLARTLQVLLSHISSTISNSGVSSGLLGTLEQLSNNQETNSTLRGEWVAFCLGLLKQAAPGDKNDEQDHTAAEAQEDVIGIWKDACELAAKACSSFLLDAGIIIQILVPGFEPCRGSVSDMASTGQNEQDKDLALLDKLRKSFYIENFTAILESTHVRDIVSNWYNQACQQLALASTNELFRTQGFRGSDWPCVSSSSAYQQTGQGKQQVSALAPMKKQPVALIGEATQNGGGIPMLASSYMDLYAKASKIRPDAERTAVCLVCGCVLNAGGKGECTRHSYTCGAGTGIFFLLQDYVGLIMHQGFGSYIRSIYVDSHGETPVGRPLFLDVARYEHLRGLWFGHEVRQQVITEREATQQGIVPNFY